MKICLGLLLLVFVTRLGAADWQYAGANGNEEDAVCNFINVDSVNYPAKGLVRFWAKSVTVAHLRDYYTSNEQIVVQKAAARLAKNYSPRFLKLVPIKDQISDLLSRKDLEIEIARREVIANQPNALSDTKTSFEIDCKNQQLRILDFITFDENGRQEPKAADRGDEYEPIPAGSNGELLAMWVCSNSAKGR